MIIQCTHCKAKFRIPDSKATKDEIKARCAKCEQIFVAHKGKNAFPEVETSSIISKDDSSIDAITKNIEEELSTSGQPIQSRPGDDFSFSDSDFGLDSDAQSNNAGDKGAFKKDDYSDDSIPFADSDMDQSESAKAPAEGDTHQKLKEEVSEEIMLAETMAHTQALAENDLSAHEVNKKSVTYREVSTPGIEEEVSDSGKAVAKIQLKKVPIAGLAGKTRVQKKEWKPGKWIYALYPIVIVAAVFSGFMVAGVKGNFKNIELLSSKVSHPMSGDFLITDISSRYTTTVSEKDLFVISGWIFNNTNKDANKLILEVELYSKEKSFIAKEKFPCCVTLSKISIHEVPDDSFETFYSDDKISTLESYRKFPFTLIFKKPEETVESFRINIING